MNPRAAHFGAEEVDLRQVAFTPEPLACVPAACARRYRVLPISSSRDRLRLALADPSDLDAIDSLHHLLHRDLELCVAEESQMAEFIERLSSLLWIRPIGTCSSSCACSRLGSAGPVYCASFGGGGSTGRRNWLGRSCRTRRSQASG